MAIIALISVQAEASVVATWNFDSGTQNGTAYSGQANYTANTYVLADFSSATLNATANTGASQVAAAGNGSGIALGFTTPSTSTPKTVTGSTFVLTLKASTAINITSIGFNYLSTSSSATTVNWAYTISGGGTGSASDTLTRSGAWQSASAFAGISLSSGQTITFTATLAGAGNGHSEDTRFDNITINAASLVPEPVNLALGAFGILAVGLGLGRRIYTKTQI